MPSPETDLIRNHVYQSPIHVDEADGICTYCSEHRARHYYLRHADEDTISWPTPEPWSPPTWPNDRDTVFD